jgi:hypothetical protein
MNFDPVAILKELGLPSDEIDGAFINRHGPQKATGMYGKVLCMLAARSPQYCHSTIFNAESLTYFALTVYLL